MTTIDKHTAIVTFDDDSTAATFSDGSSVTIDEQWAPYVQAGIEIALPDDLSVLDPRTLSRASIRVQRVFADSQPVSSLSTLFTAADVGDLTSAYGAGRVSDISPLFTRLFLPGETRRPQIRVFDLGIRDRIDRGNGSMTISLASDEALLQDYKSPGDGAGTSFALVDGLNFAGSLVSLVKWVITKVIPGATFAPFTHDFNIVDQYITYTGLGQGYEWWAGVSAWEFLQPNLQRAGLRLWCDEARLWHLDPAPAVDSGTLTIQQGENLVEYSDSLARDGDSGWYNAVVLSFEYVNELNLRVKAVDSAPDPFPESPRVLSITYQDIRFPGTGGAAKMLARTLTRGRTLPSKALSDYTATPGMAVTIEPLNSDPLDAVLASVSWSLTTFEMDVTVRDTGD